MTRGRYGIALAACVLTVACGGTQKAAEQDKTEALEQRIAELEKQLPSPSPATSPDDATGALSGEAPAPTAVPPARKANPQRVRTDPEAVTPRSEAPQVEREPVRVADAEPARREPLVPRPDPIVLPAGTELTLVLENTLGTTTSREGDAVTARVERAAGSDGRILLPGGTVVRGHVAEVRPSGRAEGRAFLRVVFDRIAVRGRTHELETTDVAVEARGEGGRDAKIIGGSTAAGAVIGGILGGGKGALKGAIVGAGAGGSAALIMKGKEIEIPAGARWSVKVQDTLKL